MKDGYKVRRGVILDKACVIDLGAESFVFDDLSDDDVKWLETLCGKANRLATAEALLREAQGAVIHGQTPIQADNLSKRITSFLNAEGER